MISEMSSSYIDGEHLQEIALRIPDCLNNGWQVGEQQDVSEFLGFLILYIQSNFQPLADMFTLQMESTRTCCECSSSRISNENMKFLTVQIPSHQDNGLRH